MDHKTLKILPCGVDLCLRHVASMSELECAELLDSQPSFFFILDKAKAIPIRIGTQTAWEAVSLDFIDNKDKKLQQKIAAR